MNGRMLSPEPTSLSEYRDQLLEEGWFELARSMSKNATQPQIDQARKIFYYGALHLWSLMQEIMDEDNGSMPQRNAKLADIYHELQRFVDEQPPTGVH